MMETGAPDPGAGPVETCSHHVHCPTVNRGGSTSSEEGASSALGLAAPDPPHRHR